jgi:hypothetical protein
VGKGMIAVRFDEHKPSDSLRNCAKHEDLKAAVNSHQRERKVERTEGRHRSLMEPGTMQRPVVRAPFELHPPANHRDSRHCSGNTAHLIC